MRERARHQEHKDVELTPEAQFEGIYLLTYQKTLAYARRRTMDMSDALDVVSETYLVAWRRLSTLLAADEPQLWLYGIARRVLLNLNRSQRRRESLFTRTAEAKLGRPERDPAESVAATEELVVVLRAMATLSEADQEVLRLAVYEELSHTEVAAAMGARPALVRTALFRARRRLEQATIKLSRQRIRSSGHVHRDRPVDEGNKERPQ